MGRRIIISFLVFLVMAIVFFVYALPNAILAYRTLYIVSHVVPIVPTWFEWGRYEVEVREVFLTSSTSTRSGPARSGARPPQIDTYFPKDKEKTSFIIFFPGFNPDGTRDTRLVNLAHSFAGAGVGVAVPDSEHIKTRTFSREDIDLIKETFHFLQDQSYVDPDRIALSGFSIAGSYILRAGSEFGDEPLFVHSLGAYYNLEELFEEVVLEKVLYKGIERSWQPDSLAKELAAQLDTEVLQGLSDDISPSKTLANAKTRVFLMHDRNDKLIPVEESRKIRDALPKDISVSYSEFSLIRHVTPQAFFSLDILKLAGQVFGMMKLLL